MGYMVEVIVFDMKLFAACFLGFLCLSSQVSTMFAGTWTCKEEVFPRLQRLLGWVSLPSALLGGGCCVHIPGSEGSDENESKQCFDT